MRRALQQPLVSRPAYGEGSGLPGAGPGGAPLYDLSGIPEGTDPQEEWDWGQKAPPKVGEAKLPEGDPAAKGLSLDKGIPGTSTFNKPEDDIRDFDRSDQGTNSPGGKGTDPWRRDSPDDQLKDRERVDTKEDWSEPHDGIGEMGKGKTDQTPMNKTPYPYRDDPKHPHYARFNPQADWVAQLYLLRFAHEAVLTPKPRVRTAATIDDMTRGLERAIEDRGDKCHVRVRRVDAANLRWIFSVGCGHGDKVVRLKAQRVGNIVRLTKMQLRVSCSCPAWRWLGPEYHAKKDKYLDGRPQGTASTPDIKDPHRNHLVCKHVSAVLSHVRGWEVPLPKGEEKE